MRLVSYSEVSAVGCVVNATMDELVKRPTLISQGGEFWDKEYPEKAVRRGSKWLEEVAKWLKEVPGKDQDESQFVRIIPTADDKATAERIKNFFSDDEKAGTVNDSTACKFKVYEIDAGKPMKFDDSKGVTHFINTKIGATSMSYAPSRSRLQNEDVDKSSMKSRIQATREVYIISRASFLPSAKLEYVVSECAWKKIKLILLVADATFSISRFRVFKEHGTTSSVPPVWIRVPIITQTLLDERGHSIRKAVVSDGSSGTEEPHRSLAAFVGLQLIFSPEAVVQDDHEKQLRDFLDLADDDMLTRLNKLNFLGDFDCLTVDIQNSDRAVENPCAQIRSAMVEILSSTQNLKEQTPNSQEDTAKWSLACVVAEHVKRYVRFCHDTREEVLVSFSDFCKQPKVRFLSQIHRIEAYMWFMFHATTKEQRFSCRVRFSQGNGRPPPQREVWKGFFSKPVEVGETDEIVEAPFGWPLASSFELGQAPDANVHHAASPGSVLRCPLKASYNTGPPLPLPLELPEPQYIDPGKGDAVTQMQDIFEHRALTGSELHWEDLYRTWETGLEGVTNEVLEHVLINSPCRLSVLLSLGEDHIVHMTLSKEAIQKVGEDFNSCKDLLR